MAAEKTKTSTKPTNSPFSAGDKLRRLAEERIAADYEPRTQIQSETGNNRRTPVPVEG